jgi:hypothetical protein
MEVYLKNHRRAFKEEYIPSIRKTILDTVTHSELQALNVYLFDGQAVTSNQEITLN